MEILNGGLFDSYSEAEEEANNAKEEYMNDWDIEDSEYDPDDFCIEYVQNFRDYNRAW